MVFNTELPAMTLSLYLQPHSMRGGTADRGEFICNIRTRFMFTGMFNVAIVFRFSYNIMGNLYNMYSRIGSMSILIHVVINKQH